MTTFFHWFVAVYLVLSDVHTFYSLPTIDDKAVSLRFNPHFHCLWLFILSILLVITMCEQLIMKKSQITEIPITCSHTVLLAHLFHDSFINSLKKQKKETQLNSNFRCFFFSNSSLSLALSLRVYLQFLYTFLMLFGWNWFEEREFQFISAASFSLKPRELI